MATKKYTEKKGTMTLVGHMESLPMFETESLVIDTEIAQYTCGCPVPIKDQSLTDTADGVQMTLTAPGLCPQHSKPIKVNQRA
jgi:hypothetical protein